MEFYETYSLNGLEALLPFIAAGYTMWVTPGPNNMMLAYSGARFGIYRTMPHILGIISGSVLLNTLGILALKPLIEHWPISLLILKIVGSVWLVRIGWKMATASRSTASPKEDRPMGFFAAALFQFVNPKAVTAMSAVASLVLVAAEKNQWLLAVALLTIPLLIFGAIVPWVLAGHTIRRFLSNPLRWKIFTWTTGILTSGCAIFLWI